MPEKCPARRPDLRPVLGTLADQRVVLVAGVIGGPGKRFDGPVES